MNTSMKRTAQLLPIIFIIPITASTDINDIKNSRLIQAARDGHCGLLNQLLAKKCSAQAIQEALIIAQSHNYTEMAAELLACQSSSQPSHDTTYSVNKTTDNNTWDIPEEQEDSQKTISYTSENSQTISAYSSDHNNDISPITITPLMLARQKSAPASQSVRYIQPVTQAPFNKRCFQGTIIRSVKSCSNL